MAIRTIRSIAELNRELNAADEASRTSHAQYLRILEGFVLDPRAIVGELPKDPRSPEYRDAQFKLYELVAGKPYRVEFEETPFDHSKMMQRPFPYSSGNPALVGDYLMTYGNLIKTMDLPLHARILEVGSGFGPLTHHLASMGHSVTCLDISSALLAYVSERTAGLSGRVETRVADMNDLNIEGSFDVILFFESFHHCANHIDLLRRLPGLLEPGGILVLAGEPIVPENTPAVPYPWGVRVDGVSLWFASRHGWLELGFEESYLFQLLESLGWTVVRKPSGPIAMMGVWMARRAAEDSLYAKPPSSEPFRSWLASNPELHSQFHEAGGQRECIASQRSPGYLLYGPYTPLDVGFYDVQWCGHAEPGSRFTAEVACIGGTRLVRQLEIAVEPGARQDDDGTLARTRFKVDVPATDFEFRIHLHTATEARVEKVLLRRY